MHIANADNRRRVDASIESVVVMEDRARVSRRLNVDLSSGLNKLLIENVSPLVVDKTLTATAFDCGASVKINDLSIKRRKVAAEDAATQDSKALLDEIDVVEALISQLENGKLILSDKIISLNNVLECLLKAFSQESACGHFDEKRSGEQYAELSKRLCEVQAAISRTSAEIEAEKEKLNDLKLKMEVAEKPPAREGARLLLDAISDKEDRASIVIEYIVPNACWRPSYRAILSQDMVSFSALASVWQNTGEDWGNVDIMFSTERASLGSAPPTMKTDTLETVPKSNVVEVEDRDEDVHSAGLEGISPVKTEVKVPGIDSRGLKQNLKTCERKVVLSNGRPHLVKLSVVDLEARLSSIACPEQVDKVVQRSEHINKGQYPILPGPVDLIRNGGFIGRTEVSYVAAGEEFEIGWGPDEQVSVFREEREHPVKKQMLTSWHEKAYVVEIRLGNLSSQTKKFLLRERIPVSEIEKVRIDYRQSKTTGKPTPDENGFIEWQIELQAFERKTMVVEYSILTKSDVVKS